MNTGALSYTCLSFQWTYYPNGKPVSVNVVLSGIRSDDGRMLMLNEGDMPQAKEEIDQMAIRRVEILRHLPLAVAQFDSSGCLMEQNPESMNMFGGSNSKGPGLVDRFVDKSAGQQALQAILESEDNFRLDAELHTMEQGTRWFAIKAREEQRPRDGWNGYPVFCERHHGCSTSQEGGGSGNVAEIRIPGSHGSRDTNPTAPSSWIH